MLRHPEGLLPCQIVTGLSKYIVTDPNKYKMHSRLTHLGGFLLYPICGSRSPQVQTPWDWFQTPMQTVAETPGIRHQYHHYMSATKCQQLTTCRPDLWHPFPHKIVTSGFEVIKTRVRDQYLMGWRVLNKCGSDLVSFMLSVVYVCKTA